MADSSSDTNNGGIVSVLRNGVIALNAIVTQIGKVFPSASGTSTSATTGPSITLPAHPVGYITVTLPDGTIGKVPYYNS